MTTDPIREAAERERSRAVTEDYDWTGASERARKVLPVFIADIIRTKTAIGPLLERAHTAWAAKEPVTFTADELDKVVLCMHTAMMLAMYTDIALGETADGTVQTDS